MIDPVNLVLPADARFRGLAPDVGGRYVVAAGGSEDDARVVVGALTAAMDALTGGATGDAEVALHFRTAARPDGVVEVTVTCAGKSLVVTHPLRTGV